jgi:hypothetical protein
MYVTGGHPVCRPLQNESLLLADYWRLHGYSPPKIHHGNLPIGQLTARQSTFEKINRRKVSSRASHCKANLRRVIDL